MSNSPIARLAEAILLPALVCVAAEALLFSMYRLLCLTVRTVRTTRSRAFRCIESALFWVVDMIFWRIPCKANLVFHQTCSYVKNLAIRGWRLVLRINDKAISLAFQKISRANRRLLQALWSPISATGSLATDLVRNIHEPGAVHVDPRLEARFFYTAFFFGCFVFSAYVHIVHLGYPLRSSIPLSAGWASVLLVYSAVAQYFSPPANLELDTAVLIMESEVPPRPANPALAQFRESSSSPKATPLLMSFEDPPIAKSASESPSPSPSRPPSPNPSSSGASSEGEEEEEEEELDTTDWAFVLRRSLTEDLHRALSPIMEVSSAASTVSLAFSESPASPIQSPSPKHTAAAAATTPPATPRHVPTTPVSLARVEAQRVSKARAQRDMTEFLSFSVALESKTPARVRAGGDGDGLQSNGADVKDAEVEVDVAAAAMVVEKAGAREEASAGAGGGAGRNAVNWRRRVGGGVVEFVPKFDQSKARPCRQNCEAFYCAGECGDRVGPV
ncbi:hypothetical protein K438DRAFT_23091 [Mycena galopus ATCC 62051]|nr:hypothetical protein K438DRAFT_23091 [Mycena galopus ATCC 62051]